MYGHIKITDFGLSKEMDPNGIKSLTYYTDKTYTFCGTPSYMAPETLKNSGYSHATDWWTLGAVTYEMFSGKSPFYSKDKKEIFTNIMQVYFIVRINIERIVSVA